MKSLSIHLRLGMYVSLDNENIHKFICYALCLTFTCLLQLFREIASEANKLLNDLQSSLYSQKDKLTAYAHQQREVGICRVSLYLFLEYPDLVKYDISYLLFETKYRRIPDLLLQHDQFLKLP